MLGCGFMVISRRRDRASEEKRERVMEELMAIELEREKSYLRKDSEKGPEV